MEGLGVEGGGGGGRSVGSLNVFPASDIKLAASRVDIKIDISVSVFSCAFNRNLTHFLLD